MRALLRSRTAGRTRLPAVRLRWAISKTRRATLRVRSRTCAPDPPQAAGEHPDPVGQERGVRGVMNVGFDDGGVDAQAPAADDAVLARQGHQAGEDVLEYRFVQQMRQPDQCLRVRNTFSVDPAERTIDQASPDLSLAFIEAPVGEMLEDEHPQHDGGGRSQSAPALTLRVALRQGLRHAI